MPEVETAADGDPFWPLRALALAAKKLVKKMKRRRPLMRRLTVAGPRMPFAPCLGIPNSAMSPERKPRPIRSKASRSMITGDAT